MPDGCTAAAAGDRLLSAQIFTSLEHSPALLCILCSSSSGPDFGMQSTGWSTPLPISFSLEEVKQLISIPGGISKVKNWRIPFLLLLLQHLVPIVLSFRCSRD